jgi:hypothetical protein
MIIASYAISVTYLGRETSRSRWLIEKRKKRLQKELRELKESSDVIAEMKQKIAEYTKEANMLGRNLFLLSVKGAVFMPSICFIAVLLLAGVGVNSQLPDYNLSPTLVFSIFLLGVGFSYFLLILRTIEWAASRVPMPAFEVLFESGLTKEKFHSEEKKRILFRIRNTGDLLAENLSIFFFLPPEFQKEESVEMTYSVVKQSEYTDYPNYTAVVVERNNLHVDSIVSYELPEVEMPKKLGFYVVPVRVHERSVGVSEQKLTIEIVP